jgi:hypothetical protein
MPQVRQPDPRPPCTCFRPAAHAAVHPARSVCPIWFSEAGTVARQDGGLRPRTTPW